MSTRKKPRNGAPHGRDLALPPSPVARICGVQIQMASYS